ncbi:MAG: hypothetical protein AAGI69_14470 [Cyanobacteria bacterium P01_H01_bin.21]
MLGKLFGKKKSGYYLELSEDEASAVPASKPAPKAAKAAPSKAPEAKKSEPAKATTSETPAPAAAAATPAKQAAPAVPAAVSKASAAMPQEVATPEPMSDPLELIRTALAASANQTAAAEAAAEESNFAPDYLAPKPSARRRRPGPSMSPFKSMAKDMKKTTSGF